jgi:hypothetical protein
MRIKIEKRDWDLGSISRMGIGNEDKIKIEDEESDGD